MFAISSVSEKIIINNYTLVQSFYIYCVFSFVVASFCALYKNVRTNCIVGNRCMSESRPARICLKMILLFDASTYLWIHVFKVTRIVFYICLLFLLLCSRSILLLQNKLCDVKRLIKNTIRSM